MDSTENLIALPANQAAYFGLPNLGFRPMHGGAHPTYNAAVFAALAPLAAPGAALGAASVKATLASIAMRFRRELIRNRALWHPRVG